MKDSEKKELRDAIRSNNKKQLNDFFKTYPDVLTEWETNPISSDPGILNLFYLDVLKILFGDKKPRGRPKKTFSTKAELQHDLLTVAFLIMSQLTGKSFNSFTKHGLGGLNKEEARRDFLIPKEKYKAFVSFYLLHKVNNRYPDCLRDPNFGALLETYGLDFNEPWVFNSSLLQVFEWTEDIFKTIFLQFNEIPEDIYALEKQLSDEKFTEFLKKIDFNLYASPVLVCDKYSIN